VAELFASGAYDAALKKLGSDTQSGKVLFNTGLVQMKAGRLRDAHKTLTSALAKDKWACYCTSVHRFGLYASFWQIFGGRLFSTSGGGCAMRRR
jgi:hypothetical protein